MLNHRALCNKTDGDVKTSEAECLNESTTQYASTPDGMVFATSSAGTRIVYDRLFLLKCRDSPLSKSAPSYLPDIPGVTAPSSHVKLHFFGNVPDSRKEIGDHMAALHRTDDQSTAFQFPSYAFVGNSIPLQCRQLGGPLAKYRQRQSMSSINQESPHPPSLSGHPLMRQTMMDYRDPFCLTIPNTSTPFTPPPMLVHPFQGPAGPIMDPMDKLSPLNLWRRNHSRNNGAGSMGYTTAKAPHLQSSFTSNEDSGSPPFGPMSNCRQPPMRPNCGNFFGPSRSDSAYESFESGLVMVIPDDPSVVACKPATDKSATTFAA